jgi:hypothetical protein
MITDTDIKKLKIIFATKEDLKKFITKEDSKKFATKEDIKQLSKRFEEKFTTKEDIKQLSKRFEEKLATKDEMNNGFMEIIKFIGETREEIVGIMTKQLDELKDITHRHQMTLENHDSRIIHLEYVNKS